MRVDAPIAAQRLQGGYGHAVFAPLKRADDALELAQGNDARRTRLAIAWAPGLGAGGLYVRGAAQGDAVVARQGNQDTAQDVRAPRLGLALLVKGQGGAGIWRSSGFFLRCAGACRFGA